MFRSQLWILTEYVPHGSVYALMGRTGPLPEAICALILHDTLEALAYLNSHGHMHLDVKPANILLTESGHCKLCDLGVAGGVAPEHGLDSSAGSGAGAGAAEPAPLAQTKIAGTVLYMSPEMVQQVAVACNTDVWSLGITAIEIATGRTPRQELHKMRVAWMTVHGPPPVLDGKVSSTFKAFVAHCLIKDTKEVCVVHCRPSPVLSLSPNPLFTQSHLVASLQAPLSSRGAQAQVRARCYEVLEACCAAACTERGDGQRVGVRGLGQRRVRTVGLEM